MSLCCVTSSTCLSEVEIHTDRNGVEKNRKKLRKQGVKKEAPDRAGEEEKEKEKEKDGEREGEGEGVRAREREREKR